MDYDEDQTPPKRRSSKLLKVLSNRKVKFVDLGGGGRTHLIGLDENYDVWVWDRAFFLPGIKLEFSFNSGLSKTTTFYEFSHHGIATSYWSKIWD